MVTIGIGEAGFPPQPTLVLGRCVTTDALLFQEPTGLIHIGYFKVQGGGIYKRLCGVADGKSAVTCWAFKTHVSGAGIHDQLQTQCLVKSHSAVDIG